MQTISGKLLFTPGHSCRNYAYRPVLYPKSHRHPGITCLSAKIGQQGPRFEAEFTDATQVQPFFKTLTCLKEQSKGELVDVAITSSPLRDVGDHQTKVVTLADMQVAEDDRTVRQRSHDEATSSHSPPPPMRNPADKVLHKLVSGIPQLLCQQFILRLPR